MLRIESLHAIVDGKPIQGDRYRGERRMIARAAGTLAFMALAGCATSERRWQSIASEGALTGWARCMETEGFEAWNGAGEAAARAQAEGATPISSTEVFLIGLAECRALGGESVALLSPQAPNRLYRDTERMLFRKLQNSRRN